MNNRLTQTLRNAKKNRAKLFCAYLTLGFPNLKRTETALIELERSGADLIELGFPFSDPLADGSTIQHASEVAIRRGVGVRDAFDVVRRARRKGLSAPILFFSYLNPILHFGVERFAKALQASGFDGAIVPDLPPEEGGKIELELKKRNQSLIYLVAPTTGRKRMRVIGKRSNGFIYFVSLRGVTGARQALPKDIKRNVQVLKRATKKPVLVGFGVSKPEQARAISRVADGIVVGSGIVSRMRNGSSIRVYVSRLVRAMRSAR
jgi:tryptophan synthase alpha chain